MIILPGGIEVMDHELDALGKRVEAEYQRRQTRKWEWDEAKQKMVRNPNWKPLNASDS